MITLQPDHPLRILFPHQNKALAEAVRQATPEQLRLLNENRDIRSLLSSLADGSIRSGRSETILLEILKNNPAFKSMGSFPADAGRLAAMLKSDGNFAAQAAKLEGIVRHITTLNGPELQRQVSDSGVFLESKMAADADPKSALKQLLMELNGRLEAPAQPAATAVRKRIGALLSGGSLEPGKTDASALKSLADAVADILKPLDSAFSSRDAAFSRDVARILDSLQTLTQSGVFKAAPSHRELLNSAWVKSALEDAKNPLPANLRQRIEASPETFIVKTLADVLGSLHDALLPSRINESGGILKLIGEIVGAIRTRLDAPLELLGDEQFGKQVSTLAETLRQAVQNGDAAFGKNLAPLLERLAVFTKPGMLVPGQQASSYLENDAKAVLLRLQHDVRTATPPNGDDILRQIDRLMVQIDYHQLVSYLSASGAVYVPFSWEGLEQGSIAFKKAKEALFYCHISLRLREFGTIDLMLALHGKNEIEIQAYTEQSALAELIRENLQALRSAMTDAGFLIRGIRVAQAESPDKALGAYGGGNDALDMGFEVKI